MKNKLNKGDIVYNKSVGMFYYIDKSNKNNVEGFVIGLPSRNISLKDLSNSNVVRYGKAKDIGYNREELIKVDTIVGNPHEQGYRIERLNMEIKLKFLKYF